jgi:hypothetical protein
MLGASLPGASGAAQGEPVAEVVASRPESVDTAGVIQALKPPYTSTSALIPNPERGLYRHQGKCQRDPYNVDTLIAYRTNEKITLVMCIFYLTGFQAAPIDAAALAMFESQAATVRKAGLKMVLRFAYAETSDDAPAARVLAHIDQLAPYLRRNSDVISVVQSGFVGAWGEGYYTKNFGDRANVTAQDWANRKAVVDKLLSVLPLTRMVQLRTPKMKRTMYGTSALTSGEAFNNTNRSRIGHHNDCFLSSATDQGTYEDAAVEYPYLTAETRYVPMGGETCVLNPPRSECTTALQELNRFHWTYLNKDYQAAVLNSWRAAGCATQVERRLGYRFLITDSVVPASVKRGGALGFQIFVQNEGFAAATNPRPVVLVLRNTANKALVAKFNVRTDPRRWTAGAATLIQSSVTIPTTMTVGTYEVLLSLPDGSSALADKPAYSIRMANGGNVWQPATGYNSLLKTVKVTN